MRRREIEIAGVAAFVALWAGCGSPEHGSPEPAPAQVGDDGRADQPLDGARSAVPEAPETRIYPVQDLTLGVSDFPGIHLDLTAGEENGTLLPRQVYQPAAGFFGGAGSAAEPRGMQFTHPGASPEVDPAEDPLSTFAVDVDTASYAMARRYLASGHLPPPESVRVEEHVNAFDYRYPDPEAGDFAVRMEGAVEPGETGWHVLAVSVQARRIDAEDRKPAALTIVLDVSGSMEADDRLILAQRALSLLVEKTRADDRVAVVAYNDRAWVVLGPTAGSEKDAIKEAIGALSPSGSTDVQGGLALGYQLALEQFLPGASNRVILCSDGVANVGSTEPGGILATVEDHVDDGIALSVAGFGMHDVRDDLLEGLADAGDGNYAYVDRLSEARRFFVENLTGTVQLLGREAKIQVEFSPSLVERFRLLGYENRALADSQFRNDRADGGEVGAGHSVTALYRVRLREGANGVAATARFRWIDPATGQAAEVAGSIERDDFSESFPDSSPAFRLAWSVASFAEWLRQGGDGNLERAEEAAAGASTACGEDRSVREFASLARSAMKLRTAASR